MVGTERKGRSKSSLAIGREELLTQFWGELDVEMHYSVEKIQFFSEIAHPYFNGLLRVNFPAATASRRVREVIAQFRARALPFHWLVDKESHPANIIDLIAENGFTREEKWHLLTYSEKQGHLPAGGEKDLIVQTVASNDALTIWAANFADSLALPFHNAKKYIELFVHRKVKPFRHFIAIYEGATVAVASLHFSRKCAVIHNLAVKRSLQGSGIGKCFVAQLVNHAKRIGVETVAIALPAERARSFAEVGFSVAARYSLFTEFNK